MRIRGIFLAALLILGIGGGIVSPLLAQDSPTNTRTILTIDQELLYKGSLFGERVASEIKLDLAKLEKEFQRLETDLTAEEQDLTKRRPTLAPDDFRVLADDFDEKVQGIRRAQDAKARELDRRLESERARYYGLVNPILHELMNDLGASLIIDGRAILVGGEGVDITSEALRLIDATLGDGATIPAPAKE